MKKIYFNDLRGLDLLRFILSISVIIWHYQHFFYPFVSFQQRGLFLEKQPFFSFLEVFYTKGYYAVQTFWLISGVIFYKVYQERISSGQITFFNFFFNRFSRLYPLHLLTLVVVVILQYLYANRYGNYFIYEKNTIQSFIQNLLFVQAWGDNRHSFNGPTWSVSIEILVYFVFFAVCASKLISSNKGLAGTFLFFLLIKKWQLLFTGDDAASSLYLFFAGCILVKIFERFKQRTPPQMAVLFLLFFSWYLTQHIPAALQPLYAKVTGYLDPDLLTFSCLAVWAFITIFNLSFFRPMSNSFFRFFGDMTYSTYLSHFPVQLLLYLVVEPTSYSAFFSPAIFLIYLLSVFLIGRLVFIYFELPVQNWLRESFDKNA